MFALRSLLCSKYIAGYYICSLVHWFPNSFGKHRKMGDFKQKGKSPTVLPLTPPLSMDQIPSTAPTSTRYPWLYHSSSSGYAAWVPGSENTSSSIAAPALGEQQWPPAATNLWVTSLFHLASQQLLHWCTRFSILNSSYWKTYNSFCFPKRALVDTGNSS